MIKDVLHSFTGDLELMGKTALMLFFLIFIGVLIYAWTRTRKELNDWSNIPLGDDLRPEEPVAVRASVETPPTRPQ